MICLDAIIPVPSCNGKQIMWQGHGFQELRPLWNENLDHAAKPPRPRQVEAENDRNLERMVKGGGCKFQSQPLDQLWQRGL